MGIFYLIFSFLLTFIAMPAVIKIAEWKKLFDPSDSRKMHRPYVSALGGIAIFGTVLVSVATFLGADDLNQFRYFLGAYLLIFLLGILDDLRQASYWIKLIVQVSAAFIIVVPGELSITSFHGLFSVFEISPLLGSAISIAFIILVVNAYNFIDGIDALAGLLGILILLPASYWFYLNGMLGWMAIALFMSGSLLGFLAYNRPPARIFMGDSGSLSTGFVIAVAAIAFLQANTIPGGVHRTLSAPALAFSLMSVPLYDLLRVFILRIAAGKSPFSPDQRHIHFRMLQAGWSHEMVLLILCLYSAGIFTINLILDHYGVGVNYLMAMDFIMMGLLCLYLFRNRPNPAR